MDFHLFGRRGPYQSLRSRSVAIYNICYPLLMRPLPLRCLWRSGVHLCVGILTSKIAVIRLTGLTWTHSSIKVITVVGLIILGLVLDLGGGPNHDRIGFRYWKNPGAFAQFNDIAGAEGRFLGWWYVPKATHHELWPRLFNSEIRSVMTQAAFSFIGTEIVAVSAMKFCQLVA
jgi:amino acid permease